MIKYFVQHSWSNFFSILECLLLNFYETEYVVRLMSKSLYTPIPYEKLHEKFGKILPANQQHFINNPSPPDVPYGKVVLVGDGATGKTCTLWR
jgi:hypothetical protein